MPANNLWEGSDDHAVGQGVLIVPTIAPRQRLICYHYCMKSKTGLLLAGAYGVVALYLILTQGLFGESFIAIILGIPWSFIFSFFEYWHAEGVVATILLILPMVVNAYLLYLVGKRIGSRSSGA